ncbi:FtsL-like putative cell division protein [Formosa sp. L2A11]|uniref:FtsL-like putative cell division protein n=1 Tax=Formosa sp. L2A11 TaxID=2686363 RepID=UPI00131E73D0|nr:FtsL-like putative cell division protein [Formosa sp. L2A11]
MKKSTYSILKGTFLVSDGSFKNWQLIVFVMVLAFFMIASSHRADRKVHEIAKLGDDVKELRSAFIDGRSRLMRIKMESSIVDKMSKKGLVPSEIPPRKIKVNIKN